MNKKLFNRKNFRWFQGKRILAYLRDGDYAHPGEEKAILKVFESLPKSDNRLLLDIGCGLGGTAQFVQDHGWGKVTGVDIEKSAVSHAQKAHPSVQFFVSDVTSAPEVLNNQKFNVIYLFNSFFAFPDQLAALKSLRKIAKNNAELIIFEYTDLTHGNNPLTKTGDSKTTFLAIRPDQIEKLLHEAGWADLNFTPINEDYERWYIDFVNKIKSKKSALIEKFGQENFQNVLIRYAGILEVIQTHQLGGCILRAKVSN